MMILYLIGLVTVFGTSLRNEAGALKQENLASALLQNGSQEHLMSDEGFEEESSLESSKLLELEEE